MTTFLPYPDFARSAECLDPARRWKQVLEARYLVDCLTGVKPVRPGATALCVRMWAGCAPVLKWYANEMLGAVLRHKTHRVTAFGPYDLASEPGHPVTPRLPWWFGSPGFHAAHRSNLLRKDAGFYGRYGWTESPDLPYLWPGSEPPKPKRRK